MTHTTFQIQKLAIVKAKNEGKEEKAIEIAKNLLKNGVDDKIIQISTGLSEDEIKYLKN